MIQRWKFVDVTGSKEPFVFRRNPAEMSNPYPKRQFTAEHTSSGLSGRPLTWEGPPQLSDMTFAGKVVNKDDWDVFLDWVYGTKGHVLIEDHLGRVMDVVFKGIDVSVQSGIKSVNGEKKPFFGEYTITALVYSVKWK